MKQCLLGWEDSVIHAWIDAKVAHAGTKVTLKDSENPDRWWEILQVYELEMDKEDIKDSHSSRKWFDNDLKRGTLKRTDLNEPLK